MTSKPYPLKALRAFETAARHLSYVEAAAELFVTPAAVSHQVKRLEEHLGVPLFRRLPHGLLLSDQGQRLLLDLGDVFRRMDQAVERAREKDARGTLTISVAPMFAVKWLLPRLHKFDALNPDIDIRLSTSLELVDLARDGFDAAVRLGNGQYPELGVVKLFDESVTPMCSPRLFKDSQPLQQPADLETFVLLHDDSMQFVPGVPTWSRWLKAAGAEQVDASRGPHFSQPDHALQAAIDGAGVVLGWCYLAAADVAAGRLVQLFDQVLPLGASFYLVFPKLFADRPKLNAFRDWLLEEVGMQQMDC